MIDSLAMVEVIQHESIEGGFLQIDGHFVNQTEHLINDRRDYHCKGFLRLVKLLVSSRSLKPSIPYGKVA